MILKNKKNKIIFVTGLTIFVFFFSFFTNVSAQNQENKVNLHVFYGQGCPHCASLLSFLADLEKKYVTLKVQEHEVYKNTRERALFEKTAKKFETEIEGVPTIFIGDKTVVGFSEEISLILENEIEKCVAQKCQDPLENLEIEDEKADIEKKFDIQLTDTELVRIPNLPEIPQNFNNCKQISKKISKKS
jgi:glutaredoxin